jgi:hypothetical protein
VALNEARYKNMKLNGAQTNEILAQAGALVREGNLVGAPVRKMILAGTSMTAGVLVNYLPAHMVYRTPSMQRIYDGFLPMSNGAMIRDVDVPVIHVPTMHEVSGNITNKQDSDEPGQAVPPLRVLRHGHIDTRDSVRLKPNPCQLPLSNFPVQAYMSVALDHLFKWVDKGTVPPRAERILLDRDEHNDGSMMAPRRARQPARRHPHELRGRADREVHDPARGAEPGRRRRGAVYRVTVARTPRT